MQGSPEKKLKKRFIQIVTFSTLIVMIFVIFGLNMTTKKHFTEKIDKDLDYIAGGFRHESIPQEPFDHPLDQETPFRLRYFTVDISRQGRSVSMDLTHIASVTSDEIANFIKSATSQHSERGFVDHYRYLAQETDTGIHFIFLDCSVEIHTFWTVLSISLGVALFVIVFVLIIVLLLSDLAIRPYRENHEKQRRFITDAGHEFKTPLAIISANTEVIEITEGKSEWTTSIRNQTARLSSLVQDLLQLSKMDEEPAAFGFAAFDIAAVLREECREFALLAQKHGKSFEISAKSAMIYHGNEESIRRLISVLADNAIKYSSPDAHILFSLSESGKKIELCTKNPAENSDCIDTEKFFDRFYRADSSRSQNKTGFGIGLSIASKIVELHKGRISAEKQNGLICVKAQLTQMNQ